MTTRKYTRKKFKKPLRLVMLQCMRSCLLLMVFALIPVFLWQQTQDSTVHRFSGVVESDSETVGPVATSRILSVEVYPGQQVQAGDVLVRLDAADRELDMAMNEARLRGYEQSLLSYEQDVVRYRQTLRESERRAKLALQEATVALAAERMNFARDEAELAGLKAEIARLKPLVERRLVSETELSSLRPKAEALEQTLTQYQPLISVLEQRCKLAQDDIQELQDLQRNAAKEGSATDPVFAAMRQTVDACRRAQAHDPAVLRASRAGVVSRVFRQPGDVVVAGEPVVRVTAASPVHITGMLSQRQIEGLVVGDLLHVTRTGVGSDLKLKAEIEMIEPEVMDLLDPFNPAPRYPVRGCRVRLRLIDEFGGLIPGESVVLFKGRPESLLEGVKRICFFSGNKAATL